jgi:hypothetical protein
MFWEYIRQEEKCIWCSETGTSPQMLCMVASGEKLAGGRHSLTTEHSVIWELLLQGLVLNSVCSFCPLMVLRVPAGRFVSGLTLRFLHCVLNSNIGLCPLWPQTSTAGTTYSWTCLSRWRCGSWGMGCSQCCFHNIYIPIHSKPFPGADGSSASTSHWMWWRIQRQHRWQRRSVRASSGQALSTATAPGTEHLGTRRSIHVSHLPKNLCGHMCNIGDAHLGTVVTR